MDKIRKLQKVIGILREYSGDGLEVQQIACLLEVMESDPEPMVHADIEDKVNLSQSSVSRNMKRLSVRLRQDANGEWIDAGLGLVDARPDHYETRKLASTLTKKGAALKERLKEVL